MHYSTVLLLASANSLVTATPVSRRAAVTKFPSGTSWDIVLNDGNFDLAGLKAAKGDVLDIDLFDNTADGKTWIKELAKTKKVICYFSAGSREDWRPDAKDFAASDYGKELDGWKGENWLDVTSTNVRNIMKKRIEAAAAAGCSAVDPDNVDGFDGNQDGFSKDASVYADYVNYLAGVAKNNTLAIGLKNALDLIPSVINNIQFAVNEECHANTECDRYKSVTKAGLAVFNIEYGINDCSEPSGVILSSVMKPANQSLDTLGGQC
ncbi:glycoside hydrolase family 114 protein [Lophiostoma macrostomum CBS 122681]|uniref:alpha-galactosidase n=1 Tax=Lophiostoma macrostomum CBS 122681 TaxID=1314788 RepID=A0A6A6SQE0_9PLEO|nr:glycoside hydrolase family 114 protein [Lophiostoma macrostomum CBS 122681]